MPWPTADEFDDFLPAAYAAAVSADQKAEALAAAIERWNELTGYWPFMSNGNAREERTFTPQRGYIIDLNGGLLGLYSLETEVQYSLTGSTASYVSGTSRDSIRDFRLKPADAPQRGKPYTYIQTGWHNGGCVIRIVGEWGFCRPENLPSAVKRAVMSLAAQDLMPQIMAEISRGGVKSIQRGDERKEWVDPAKQSQTWQSNIDWALRPTAGYVREVVL